jgi:hypothetical protein
MNSETVYSFLMGLGWFFLLGWAVALVVACASVFWGDRALPLRASSVKPGARGIPAK